MLSIVGYKRNGSYVNLDVLCDCDTYDNHVGSKVFACSVKSDTFDDWFYEAGSELPIDISKKCSYRCKVKERKTLDYYLVSIL